MDPRLRHGLARIEAGDHRAAHAAAIQMIHADVADPVPYYLLGRIAFDHRNYPKADELLAKAATLRPEDVFFRAERARFLVTVGRREEALTCAGGADPGEVGDAHAADTIGVIFSRIGFHERAVDFFQRAVELDPGPANFHYNLGASLQFSGHFQAAARAYRQALKSSPDDHRARYALVSLEKQSPDTAPLDDLVERFEAARADPDAALHLGHAIAKTLEDLDRYPESFDWLVRAKRAKRQSLDYAVSRDLQLFEAAEATARPPASSGEVAAAGPIFIIGLPRTGTTLVDRILSSHPQVTSAGELNTFADAIKQRAGSPSRYVLDSETLAAAGNDDLHGVGEQYLAQTRELARGAARFTDKMPLNFFYASLILRALPGARIVALRRGATDSCLSNFRQLFSTGFSYYNYALDMGDTAAYYMAFDRLMAVWRERLPADGFMEIHYEAIIQDQEAQTRRLLEFCGLDWHEGCLRFHENAAPVSTASSVQVRQPLYSSAIGRWRRYGDRLDDLRQRLGPLAEPDQDASASSGT